jgi:ribosomal protein S18 acetylase RimI-like enzyme
MIELWFRNFGLVAEAMGRGLGPRLLDAGLQAEWARGATRIWLHTDVLDHPAALPLYQRAGFRIYQVREEPSELL